ncbi:hypothetical protein ABK040_007427 [Willaertia magna]
MKLHKKSSANTMSDKQNNSKKNRDLEDHHSLNNNNNNNNNTENNHSKSSYLLDLNKQCLFYMNLLLLANNQQQFNKNQLNNNLNNNLNNFATSTTIGMELKYLLFILSNLNRILQNTIIIDSSSSSSFVIGNVNLNQSSSSSSFNDEKKEKSIEELFAETSTHNKQLIQDDFLNNQQQKVHHQTSSSLSSSSSEIPTTRSSSSITTDGTNSSTNNRTTSNINATTNSNNNNSNNNNSSTNNSSTSNNNNPTELLAFPTNSQNFENYKNETILKFYYFLIFKIKYLLEYESLYNNTNLLMKIIYLIKILCIYLNYIQSNTLQNNELLQNKKNCKLFIYKEKDILELFNLSIKIFTNYGSFYKLINNNLILISKIFQHLLINNLNNKFENNLNTIIHIILNFYKKDYNLQILEQKEIFENLIKSTSNIIVTMLKYNYNNNDKIINFLEIILNKNIKENNNFYLNLDNQLKHCTFIFLFINNIINNYCNTLQQNTLQNNLQNDLQQNNFNICNELIKIYKKKEKLNYQLLVSFVCIIVNDKIGKYKFLLNEIIIPIIKNDILQKSLQKKLEDNRYLYSLIIVQILYKIEDNEIVKDFVNFIWNEILLQKFFLINENLEKFKNKLKLLQKTNLYFYFYLIINNLILIKNNFEILFLDNTLQFIKHFFNKFTEFTNLEKIFSEELKIHLKHISSCIFLFLFKIYTFQTSTVNNNEQNVTKNVTNNNNQLNVLQKNNTLQNSEILKIIEILSYNEFMKDLDATNVYNHFLSKLIEFHNNLFLNNLENNFENFKNYINSKNIIYLSRIYFYLNFFTIFINYQFKLNNNEITINHFKKYLIPFMFQCLQNENKNIIHQSHQLFLSFFNNYPTTINNIFKEIRQLIIPYYLSIIFNLQNTLQNKNLKNNFENKNFENKNFENNETLINLFCNSFHHVLQFINDYIFIEYFLQNMEWKILNENDKKRNLILLLLNCTQTIYFPYLDNLFEIIKKIIDENTLKDFYGIVYSCMDYTRRDKCIQFYLELQNNQFLL